LVVVLLIAMGCAAHAPEEKRPPPPPDLTRIRPRPLDYFVYEVRSGDTLFALGRRFRVPWRDIAEANDISHADQLRVGRPLLIPRAVGVQVPELPSGPPERPAPAPRKPVIKADLHRGKPSAPFWWPTHGRLVRSYGAKVRGLEEKGIGIAAAAGIEVYAVADGKVITVVRADRSPPSAWGNVVAISHSGAMVSWYGQLDRILVEKGRNVKKGDPIGTLGATGAAARPELAFRLYRNERPLDPEDYLP
jgi:murein DD-endopeptidase MepM/ murein hydrolase activator NlpD